MFEDPEIKKESVQTSDEEIKEEMPTENAPENVPEAPVEAIPEAPAEPSEVTPEEPVSAPEIPQEEKSYAAGRVYSPENPEGAAYYRDVPFIRAEEGPVYEAPV
ncbi:MAG: hypothetical protein MJ141_03920, partial [Clostridia bacterium]|nr:hypothetical protein [Clostridia bacterium]